MKKCACAQRRKRESQLAYLSLILLLSLALIQTIQITQAQDTTTKNPWAINLQILNDKNTTANIFHPFDLIQLRANVTYDNASQPDILVTFNVTGPSSNPTSIIRIETTQANGEAEFSFRLPIQGQSEESIIGIWNATATISYTQPQSSSFTTQWSLVTTSINLLNSQGQNQTVFSPGSNVAVQVEIKNQGQAQPANVTLNMQDSTGQIINQTEILNSQIASSNQTQVQTTLQIPDNAVAGQASINVALYSGTYNGTNIPIAENQTTHFTIATATILTPTPTPTATPTTTPTKPPSVETSVSLFAWLLVATGLFTFTLLVVFLKRKQKPTTSQTPSVAPSTPSPETATPAPGQSTTLQETIQQPAPQTTAPTPKIAPEKVMEATVMSEINLNEKTEAESKPVATIEVVKPGLEPAQAHEPAAQPTLAQLERILSTAKRIQAIKTTLKSVREQLAQDLTELNRLLDERERALSNYFDTVRGEMEKAKTHLTDIEDTSDETVKPNSAPYLAQEPTSQAISTYRSRIASTEKRIQTLNIALKLEEEQLAKDLTEFNKAVDQQEKTLNNYFGILRHEIEKLQTYLTDKENSAIQQKNRNQQPKDY